ncbi:MAG: ABC transporter ATP-binding protein [Acidimicrobiales bacterium]
MGENLAVANLDKAYPGRERVVMDLSLAVDPGTFLVLLGPSGSGKTTLLRCIAGIERVTAGQITIGTRTVADGRKVHFPPERRDLSMVFQDYGLWPHLSARDNVVFAHKRLGTGKNESRKSADSMLERVGLGALGDRYPSELSGGEQQRVALARALVGETGLLLCDEPLSNLDADLRERMRIEISSLIRDTGTTTVYITHDQAEAFALADQVGVLQKGRLVQLGSPEQVYERPATPFVARFTGLAGELAIRVVSPMTNGTAEVEIASASAVQGLRAPLGVHRLQGGTGVLFIRPAAVHLASPEGEDHHLLGTVRDVAFRGRGYEHVVELAEGDRITGIFSDLRARRGEHVGLRLEASGCLVFPDSGPSQGAEILTSQLT